MKDGELNFYPCGKCVVCLNAKSYLLEQCTRYEADKCKYLLFGTLTYRNKDLPTLEVVSEDRTDGTTLVSWISRTDRVTKFYQDDLFFERIVNNKEFYLRMFLYNKSRLPERNCFGVLFYRDVQLFMKRLRRRIDYAFLKEYCKNNCLTISKLTYEEKKEILRTVPRYRFLCVGEYGPKTFRPHYHLLFYCNSEWLQDKILGLFGEVWTYGRTDIQLSYGQASSYVSSYLNSSLSLPPVIKDVTKRSVVHSSAYGWSAEKESFEDIREVTYERLAARSLIYAGKSHELRLPVSFENSLFPRTYGFSYSTDISLMRRYTSYRYLSEFFGCDTVEDIVAAYVRWFNLDGEDLGPNHNDSSACDWCAPDILLGYNQRIRELKGYFANIPIYMEYDTDSVFPDLVSRLRSILYTSRSFLCNCGRYNISEYAYLRLIRQYYNDKDKYLLSRSFHDMLEVTNPAFLVDFYNNVPALIATDSYDLLDNYLDASFDNSEFMYYAFYPEENLVRKYKIEDAYRISSNKVKHKTQNDLNNFLIYD